MSRIKDLVEGAKKLIVEGYIVEKDTPRKVVGRIDGNEYYLCYCLLAETKKAVAENSITLVIWENDIDKYRVGDKVKIENGYVTSFNGALQLNIGKYGAIKMA